MRQHVRQKSFRPGSSGVPSLRLEGGTCTRCWQVSRSINPHIRQLACVRLQAWATSPASPSCWYSSLHRQ